MELTTDFDDFIKEIRPTKDQRSEMKSGHVMLRKLLREDADVSPILVSDFLQGSYIRDTAVRPRNDQRSDVDIIVVTKLDEKEYTPTKAMGLFEPFLNKHYKGKWRRQGRSLGIELSFVEMDLVITSAPSESEYGILQSEAVTSGDDINEARDWRLHRSWLALGNRIARADTVRLLAEANNQLEWQAKPLRIPDREAEKWYDTHPLEQIKWTRDMNGKTNGHFIHIVKALKWWRLENYDEPKHPKGFPLERIIGDCCPEKIKSVAEGILRTLEAVVSKYSSIVLVGGKPTLPDYGVPSNDVLHRLDSKDFKMFYEQAKVGAMLARQAYDSQDRAESGNLWRKLLGNKFPKPPEDGGTKNTGFSEPSKPAVPGSGRFA